ncbi:MAG: CARDB domain-containing protein [Bacillota bacterium]
MNQKSKIGKIKWLSIIFVMVLCFTQYTTVFAGEPSLKVSGSQVFTIDPQATTNHKIQLINKGTSTAKGIYVQMKTEATAPFSVQFVGGNYNTNLNNLGVNAFTDLSIIVKPTGILAEEVYAVTLDISYYGEDDTLLTTTETLTLKTSGYNDTAKYNLTGMSLSPEILQAGETATLSGYLKNNGTSEIVDVELKLSGLSTEGIALSGGFSTFFEEAIPVGGSLKFEYPLIANSDMVAGNYPLTFDMKFTDAFNKVTERTQEYYIAVAGAEGTTAGEKPQVTIQNLVEPANTFGVNENFTITFDVHNKGEATAQDIVVTAEALESTSVVPKSSSMEMISALEVGETKSLSFTFSATEMATTQNYAIQFTTQYGWGDDETASTKQFAGVNIYNPENTTDDDTDSDTVVSKPQIVISKYESDPKIVMAGEEFDLQLVVSNQSKTTTVENIKMFLTLAEETSSSSELSGNVFIPVDSSNTFYFDEISPKGSVSKDLRLYVVPEAQPKTYTLTVNFEYEDGQGNTHQATELLGIRVKQVTELRVDEFTLPEMVDAGMPLNVSFQYYNVGRVALSNVEIRVEGDVEAYAKNTYIGNMDSGDSGYFDTSFTAYTPGEVPVDIVIAYEDSSGEVIEHRNEFLLFVNEPMYPDPFLDGDMMYPEFPEEQNNNHNMLIYGGIGAVLAVIAVVILAKKKKMALAQKAIEADDDDDEDEDKGVSL